jgi:hypothetical protein
MILSVVIGCIIKLVGSTLSKRDVDEEPICRAKFFYGCYPTWERILQVLFLPCRSRSHGSRENDSGGNP